MGWFNKKNKGITINIKSDATMWYDKNNSNDPNNLQGRNSLGQFTKDTLGQKILDYINNIKNPKKDNGEYDALKEKVRGKLQQVGIKGQNFEDIFNSIYDYVSGQFMSIDRQLTDDEKKKVAIIDRTVDLLPKYNGMVFRGMAFDKRSPKDMAKLNNLLKKCITSFENQEPFILSNNQLPSSFTADSKIAMEFSKYDELDKIAVFLKLNNKTGASIKDMSQFEREQEVLHKSTQQYKTIGLEKQKNPENEEVMYFISLEEINDGKI